MEWMRSKLEKVVTWQFQIRQEILTTVSNQREDPEEIREKLTEDDGGDMEC